LDVVKTATMLEQQQCTLRDTKVLGPTRADSPERAN